VSPTTAALPLPFPLRDLIRARGVRLPTWGHSDDANPTTPETAVVGLAREGDAGAFRSLYEAHVGRVYGLCVRLTGNEGEAEELTQDVFVRAWERLSTFRGDSAFSTWLYRLAVNQVLMARRGRWRRERRILLSSTAPEAPAPTPQWDNAMDLERAIATLPDRCRVVFVLHDIEGWPHADIAVEMGTAVGTCKAHLFRARRLLRKVLAP